MDTPWEVYLAILSGNIRHASWGLILVSSFALAMSAVIIAEGDMLASTVIKTAKVFVVVFLVGTLGLIFVPNQYEAEFMLNMQEPVQSAERGE